MPDFFFSRSFMIRRTTFIQCAILLLVLISIGCKQIRKVADVLVQPTAREIYARNFENDNQQFAIWERAFKEARKDSLLINLPYVEIAKGFSHRYVVYSYNLFLEEGVTLHVDIKNREEESRFFIDVLQIASDSSIAQFAQNEINSPILQIEIETTGTYKILIQPEINALGDFEIQMYNTPRFMFPVAGSTNDAVQSFWGAKRDAGARLHEGIDIFATRGTPVVAAAEGRITSAGNRGLGGKQVWLRTGLLGKSLYYAHLDSIMAQVGDRVNVGDTLGLVGNTGNARSTAPHLHFGIYKTGKGAVNPLPFVWKTTKPELTNPLPITPQLKVSSTRANLRNSPTTNSLVVGEAIKSDTLQLLGYTNKWAHVLTASGKKAFVHSSLVATP
ncbi:murein DD-endopeptidase MepM/ murein hydrolase activator NlpD [Maribacter sp. MAR_2009_72]|nr:murein DD-endopeptidase MepM/ murein hydrolase activator NlpD [Maribacter sp. MAR_2009_72]